MNAEEKIDELKKVIVEITNRYKNEQKDFEEQISKATGKKYDLFLNLREYHTAVYRDILEKLIAIVVNDESK